MDILKCFAMYRVLLVDISLHLFTYPLPAVQKRLENKLKIGPISNIIEVQKSILAKVAYHKHITFHEYHNRLAYNEN